MGRHLVALAACAVLTLGGCGANVTSESHSEAVPLEVTSGPATFTAEPGPKPEGRFYAVIGGDTSNDNRLYSLRFSPPGLRLLTGTRRVSSVGACPEQVVVAAGQPEVGFSDHLQSLEGNELRALEGLGVQGGFNPELDEHCRVAYTWVDRDAESSGYELRVWDPEQKAERTLYRSKPGDGPLVSPDWGPDGEVAVVRLDPKRAGQQPAGTPPGAPAAVIIVRPDGTTSDVAVGGDPGVLAWGPRWLAVMDETEGTVFVDPESGKRATLPGWHPLSWSPGGDQLLVNGATDGGTLGVVEASDLTSVNVVGQVSGPVFDVDWLPA
ncbi:MAG: hypothetical protein ACRDY7_08970 [Acidimicrobiia bacterium]